MAYLAHLRSRDHGSVLTLSWNLGLTPWPAIWCPWVTAEILCGNPQAVLCISCKVSNLIAYMTINIKSWSNSEGRVSGEKEQVAFRVETLQFDLGWQLDHESMGDQATLWPCWYEPPFPCWESHQKRWCFPSDWSVSSLSTIDNYTERIYFKAWTNWCRSPISLWLIVRTNGHDVLANM